jgi:arginine utilization regulatory protein
MFDKSLYAALDKIGEGIIIFDKNSNIIFMNGRAAEIQNIDRNKVINKSIYEVFPSVTEKSNIVNKVLKLRKPIIDIVEKYKTYNGEGLTIVSSSYPIFTEKKVDSVIKIFNKIHAKSTLIDKAELPKEIFVAKRKIRNKDKSQAVYDFLDIIGKSNVILEVKEKCFKAAKTSSPVLIFGETGTGKELFVQAIHNNSYRMNKPFVAQNCAAIPQGLFESILFGTVKGSFTGAESRKGLFEVADGGTLYLDELNSMSIELQGKLLRTLQEGTIRKVGDSKIKKIDVKVIASVNEEPEKLLESGKLRSDLFFRLNVVNMKLPPLRERKEDIPLLVKFFIDKFNDKFKANIEGIDKEALNYFILRNWYGNVRELEHKIESAFNVKQKGILVLEDFQLESREIKLKNEIIPLKDKMEELEKAYIKEALVISENNISKAAKHLKIPRQTLQYKIKKFHLYIY